MLDRIKEPERVSRLLEPQQDHREEWNAEVLDYANIFFNKLGAARTDLAQVDLLLNIIQEKEWEVSPLKS